MARDGREPSRPGDLKPRAIPVHPGRNSRTPRTRPSSPSRELVVVGARQVKRPSLMLFALVALLSSASPTDAKTLRVFVIGNSFSNNALLYLPKIVQSAGDEIVVKSA